MIAWELKSYLPVTKFWLFVAVDKVEVASGMNGGVLVWKSNCAAA